MEAAIYAHGYCLPPFCGFEPGAWASFGREYDEIRDNKLGWDITDFGLGDFAHVGFSLLTIRNGNPRMADRYPKTYAEKLLYLKPGQYAPNHFHWRKREDIINRGGGTLLIRVHNALADEGVDRAGEVAISMDGVSRIVPAGMQVRLTPGMSITIQPYLYHDFQIEPGTGAVLICEVSAVNDDDTDNRYEHRYARFPRVEEDEPPYRLLCTEYPPSAT